MKKLFLLGAIIALFTVGASAQSSSFRGKQRQEGFQSGQLTRGEKFKLHKNEAQYKKARHHARHDVKVTSRERKQLHKMRKHNRHDAFRYKHNRRTRM